MRPFPYLADVRRRSGLCIPRQFTPVPLIVRFSLSFSHGPKASVRVRLGEIRTLPLRRLYSATEGTREIQRQSSRAGHILRRILRLSFISLCFAGVGVGIAIAPNLPVLYGARYQPTDAETLEMFKASDSKTAEIDRAIEQHPLARSMRGKPDFTESRPHLKIPRSHRIRHLMAGTIAGPGGLAVPPYMWIEKEGRSLVSIAYVGDQVCGNPGIIHDGVLATMLDEGMARCCFPALPNKVAMTANLNLDYLIPAPAGSFLVLKAETVKVEGRKAFVRGRIESLVNEDEKPVVYVEATSLFVEPRQAAKMAKLLRPRS